MAKNRLSNNVGGVKHFPSTLQHWRGTVRHFALVADVPIQPRLAPNQYSGLELSPRRRQDLLNLLDQLTPKIQALARALEEEVERRPVTRRLMTHPGVGPLTALAYELVIGTPERFHCGKQIASYLGLVPEEKSSGDRRRLGHITKQGNVLLRFLRGPQSVSRCR